MRALHGLAMGGIVLTAAPATALGGAVEINEFDRRFVELYDGGGGGVPLDGLVLVMFGGDTGMSYQAVDLDGGSTTPNGYFVVGSSLVPNVDLVIGGSLPIESYGAIALYQGDAVDFPNGSAATVTGLVDAVVYRANLSTEGLFASLLLSGNELPIASAHGFESAHARCPDGAGGARDLTQYSSRPATPGAPGTCMTAATFCNAWDGATAFCPCFEGYPDTGCERPVPSMQGGGTTGGVRLNVIGVQTSPFNRATLTATGLPVGSTPSLALFRASNLAATPVAFGDGVRCTGLMNFVRIGRSSALAGVGTFLVPHGVMAGSGDFYYQAWVRSTPTSFCVPSASFTTSAGVRLTW